MALVNVAAEMMKRGKRVLIIDFDLEAPGISSYDAFASARGKRGIVEYVNEYLVTNRSPDVKDYICECHLGGDGAQGPVWVLTSGIQDETYGARFNCIDWQMLYDNREGYLLFEDLKQQIARDERRFDYVLIDSRTGHTDIGGICTRQLGDAVTVMFFPNRQNISGLKDVVRDVRLQNVAAEKKIDLIFCASNVPYLDDEHGILRDMLEHAREGLGISGSPNIIHHYSSLALIDQEIFVVSRPRSRLAGEYIELHDAIARLNLRDRDGALYAIREVLDLLRHRRRQRGPGTSVFAEIPTSTLDRLDEIRGIHSSDEEVLWELSAAYSGFGVLEAERAVLDRILAIDARNFRARLRRGLNLLSQAEPLAAVGDLRIALENPDARALDMVRAANALKNIDDNWLEVLSESPALENLSASDALYIAPTLMSSYEALPSARRLFERQLIGSEGLGERSFLQNELVLTCIGMKNFSDALAITGKSKDGIASSDDIGEVFNYFFALRGVSEVWDIELARRVIELHVDHPARGANFYQCLSICFFVSGEKERAVDYAEKALATVGSSRRFSAWRYLYVEQAELERDLRSMLSQFALGFVRPVIFEDAV